MSEISQNSKKNVVVTGANGFLGTALVRELLSCQEYNVYAVTSSNKTRLEANDRLTLIQCGMNEYSRLSDILSEKSCVNPTMFFHLAWQGASGTDRTNWKFQADSASGTIQALETAHELGAGKFIAAGTVYENVPVLPDVHASPETKAAASFKAGDFYILSKKYAHEMANQLALKLSLPFVWCTFFHPIGRYIKDNQMMAYTIKSLLSGETPQFGPAKKTPYDIISVKDVAYGLRLAGETILQDRAYYIGSGNPRLLSEYLLETCRILDVETPVETDVRPDDGMRFNFGWFDTSAFMEESGFRPRLSFREAVLETAEYIRSGLSS
ncbi:hypothetical protein FACS189499_02420 [Clostridia bacterium]|nr:hypothetical protein FACS189499_02420 [Clostridia bacterium]